MEPKPSPNATGGISTQTFPMFGIVVSSVPRLSSQLAAPYPTAQHQLLPHPLSLKQSTHLIIRNSLRPNPPLQPLPRRHPRGVLPRGRALDGGRDSRALLREGAKFDVIVRAGEEHDRVAFQLGLLFGRGSDADRA